MAKCALPDHLKDKKHTDWPWPMSLLPRSINAFGPRCQKESSSYRPWPPRLIEGYGVTRWESSGANSIIEIPAFKDMEIGGWIYGETYHAIERNPGHSDYGKSKLIKLQRKEFGWPFSDEDSAIYSPSAIQEFSNKGYMRLEPSYYASWRNGLYFFRYGYRPDHLDIYYNWGPYLGMNYE